MRLVLAPLFAVLAVPAFAQNAALPGRSLHQYDGQRENCRQETPSLRKVNHVQRYPS